MRNAILHKVHNIIPYVRELREICGTVNACILMQQLDYYFAKYPNGYYKFMEPCDHDLYKPEDSWCEELGFSAEEFRGAFDKIGTRYTSLAAFNKAEDMGNGFGGKYYASYIDRRSNLTHYRRNHTLLDEALNEVLTKKPERKKQPTFTPPSEPRTATEMAFMPCRELWDKHLVKYTDIGIMWRKEGGKEGEALKDIIIKLDKGITNKQKPGLVITEDTQAKDIIKSFNYILENWAKIDKFHAQMRLSHINQYFSDIINTLRNGSLKNKPTQQAKTETQDYIQRRAQERMYDAANTTE